MQILRKDFPAICQTLCNFVRQRQRYVAFENQKCQVNLQTNLMNESDQSRYII